MYGGRCGHKRRSKAIVKILYLKCKYKLWQKLAFRQLFVFLPHSSKMGNKLSNNKIPRKYERHNQSESEDIA